MTLFVISPPLTKALWTSPITWRITFCNLEAKTFEIILQLKLHRLIDLNSKILVGFFIFGIKAVLVVLSSPSEQSPLRKEKA